MRNFLPKSKEIYFAVVGIFFLLCLFFVLPPLSFPRNSIIIVEDGSGLFEVAEKLDEDNVIRSPFWFRTFAIFLGGERQMKAGEYYMKEPHNAFVVAWRIFHGDHKVETVKITIPEGFTVAKIAQLFDQRFPLFNHAEFLRSAPEGYLFPDTYFIPVTATASYTIKLLENNFTKRVTPILPELEKSGKGLYEIITMASIIENEAQTKDDREMVSDVLWKRLDLGIPLQVDASFAHVNGKTSAELTLDDLEIDSPFNTYLHKGLPPTPISNPGLESINAALHPTTTPYLYFLTGDDGMMHYSKTFDEHVEKKFKFIN